MSIRTCIGCRKKEPQSSLLRLVFLGDKNFEMHERDNVAKMVLVVPDPRRLYGGRGAWLHFESNCFDRAKRARAFAKALRIQKNLDLEIVREYILNAQNESELEMLDKR